MGVTNPDSGTRIDEIAAGIYRISTPVPPSDFPGGFTFNQFLIDDDEPLLFHTGPRKLFPLVSLEIASVLPLKRIGPQSSGRSFPSAARSTSAAKRGS